MNGRGDFRPHLSRCSRRLLSMALTLGAALVAGCGDGGTDPVGDWHELDGTWEGETATGAHLRLHIAFVGIPTAGPFGEFVAPNLRHSGHFRDAAGVADTVLGETVYLSAAPSISYHPVSFVLWHREAASGAYGYEARGERTRTGRWEGWVVRRLTDASGSVTRSDSTRITLHRVD